MRWTLWVNCQAVCSIIGNRSWTEADRLAQGLILRMKGLPSVVDFDVTPLGEPCPHYCH